MSGSELLSKQRRYNIGEYKNLNRLTANTVTLDYLKFGMDTSNVTITYPNDLINDGYTLVLPKRSGVSGEFLGIDDNNKLKWGNPNVINNVFHKYGHGLNSSFLSAPYTAGTVISPDNYEITIKPTSTTAKLLLNIRVAYQASNGADTAITFEIFKRIGQIETLVQSEANLGPSNATGGNISQYVASIIIEAGTKEEITFTLGFKFNLLDISKEDTTIPRIGILGYDDGYNNLMTITDYEGSGTSTSLFSKSHDNESIYFNQGSVFIGKNFNSLNTNNTNNSLVTENIFSNNIEVSGNLIYNNVSLNKLKIPVNNSNQDFFDLLTQQPRVFKSVEYLITSSQVTLKWSLENLYPSNNDSLFINLYENDRKILPVINNILFDLSYGNTYINSIVSLDHSNIVNDNRYITEHIFKKKYLEELSEISDISMNFDIYVYGINNSNESISDNNKLVFGNLIFASSREPSQPILDNISIYDDNNKINGNIYLDNIEIGDINTALIISTINISYNVSDSLRSNNIIVSSIQQNKVINNPTNIITSPEFSIYFTIKDLYYGTKYNIKGNAKNNGSDNFSLYSDTYTTEYTIIPDKFNNVDHNLSTINNKKKDIKNDIIPLTRIIYINNIDFLLNLNGKLETTKQDADNKDTEGYGKHIDNTIDIFNLELSYRDFTYRDFTYKYTVDNWNSFNEIENTFEDGLDITINIDDIYNDVDLKQGFRQKINYDINKINSSIFTVSNNYQNLSINFTSEFNDYSNKNLSLDFVYDNLLHNPSYTIGNLNVNVDDLSHLYCCGIPSVVTFEITFDIYLENMNSEQKWVPNNFGKIQIENEKFIDGNIFVFENSNINGNGSYTYTYDSGSLNFTESNIDNSTLSIGFLNSFIQNLKGTINIQKETINSDNLYCDFNSFDKVNDIINSLKDHVKIFYQLSNEIDVHDLNIKHLNPVEYSNHKEELNRHTLQYIDDKFRYDTSDTTRRYIITSIETNNIDVFNDYYTNFTGYLDNFSNIPYILIYYYNEDSTNISIGVIRGLNNNVGFNELNPWFNRNISIESGSIINIDSIDGVWLNGSIRISTIKKIKYYILFIYSN